MSFRCSVRKMLVLESVSELVTMNLLENQSTTLDSTFDKAQGSLSYQSPQTYSKAAFLHNPLQFD